MHKIIIMLMMALLLAGCGKDLLGQTDSVSGAGADQKTVITCDARNVPHTNYCRENIGSIYNDPEYIQIAAESCRTIGGTVSDGICLPTGSVGQCVIASGQENEVRIRYFPAKYDATSARAACDAEAGVFSP